MNIAEQYGNKCVLCLEDYSTIHHKIPTGAGGPDISSNKVPVCTDCHTMIHYVGWQAMLPEIERRAAIVRDTYSD